MTGRQKEFYEKYRDHGFEIIFINLYRDEQESTKRYAAQKGIKFPILVSNDEVKASYGDIRSTPIFFLLDKEGKVVAVFDRFNKSDLYEIENKIRSLLALEALPPPKAGLKMNLEILKANKAPDFSLPTMDGKTITLSQLDNKVVVLVFWSIADVASVGILPYFQATLYEDHHQRGLEIIGVNMDTEVEAKAKVANFLTGNQIKIPVVQATPELIKEYGNINTTPVIIIVDRYGNIKEVYGKYSYEIVGQIKDDILSLLEPTSS